MKIMYKQCAEKCRDIAQHMEPDIAVHWENTALMYERLAQQAEDAEKWWRRVNQKERVIGI